MRPSPVNIIQEGDSKHAPALPYISNVAATSKKNQLAVPRAVASHPTLEGVFLFLKRYDRGGSQVSSDFTLSRSLGNYDRGGSQVKL